MDNFRRYRSSNRSRSSTDGFINPKNSRLKSQPKLKRGNSYRPESSRMHRQGSSDGFRALYQKHRQVSQPQADYSKKSEPNTVTATQKLPYEARNKSNLGQVSSRLPGRSGRKQQQGRLRRLKNLILFNPFKKNNWTKQRALAHALVLVMVIGGLFGARAWWLANKIFQGGGGAVAMQDEIDPSLLKGEGDGRVNILLMGRGGEGHEGADLTDTIVVASINPIQKEAALLSIPRDLYVRNSAGGYSKINAVFANAKEYALANSSQSDEDRFRKAENAGFEATEDVIESSMGIPIHYHGMIDFAGFAKAIDTVGGIDINVPASGEVYDNLWLMGRNYTLDVKKGQSHFDGIRALAYARSRYTSSRGDFDRSVRQRLIMVALKDKIISAGTYSNPIKINQLMSDFGNHIRTNLSINEVKRLYEIGSEIPSNKISSVDLVTAPNDLVMTDMVHGQSVVIPKAGLDNYREIQHFIRNRMRDGFLAHEDATVAIYNGTSIDGLAARTADDLKSYGYKVEEVADAPTKGVQKTIVVDLRNGNMKYTKRYLENRFKSTAVNSIPQNAKIEAGTADFVIILGQNEQTRLAN